MQPSASIVLRISDLDGGAREFVHPLAKLQIGSHPSSGLVLPGRGVAEYHCVLETTRTGHVLRDRGSRTGTFVNSERLTEPRELVPGDKIYIGEHQLELLSPQPQQSIDPGMSDSSLVVVKPGRFTTIPPSAAAKTPVRTGSVRTVRGPLLALTLVIPLVAAATYALWPETPPTTPLIDIAARTAASAARAEATPIQAPARTVVHHEVIPGETIADIAARYGVSASQLVSEHDLNPDLPPPPGTELVFEAVDPPLPKLRLRHVVEAGDTLTSLGERFDVGVELLRRYNPGFTGEVSEGAELVVWVDPQIERRHDEAVRLSFPVASDALSVGAPTAGTLERGIQLPASPYYERVHPALQYGSSHAIQHLQTALARFRQLYRYEGVLVVSDLSRLSGGSLPPHKSHQAGRDVDIWLPALKGTYQRRHLAADRKPKFAEINWYAAWGLVESLLATGQVQYVFLDISLHPQLYRAGQRLGAPADLLAQLQWQPPDVDPELARRAKFNAPVRHAAEHNGHIHVRFKCGPNEPRCTHKVDVEDP